MSVAQLAAAIAIDVDDMCPCPRVVQSFPGQGPPPRGQGRTAIRI